MSICSTSTLTTQQAASLSQNQRFLTAVAYCCNPHVHYSQRPRHNDPRSGNRGHTKLVQQQHKCTSTAMMGACRTSPSVALWTHYKQHHTYIQHHIMPYHHITSQHRIIHHGIPGGFVCMVVWLFFVRHSNVSSAVRKGITYTYYTCTRLIQ